MPEPNRGRVFVMVAITAMLFGGVIYFVFIKGDLSTPDREDTVGGRSMGWGDLTAWWDPIPNELRSNTLSAADHENISPDAYIGPESCKKCHPENYESWSEHPHRWMNALADNQTVLGDFSGKQSISYRGGTARFYSEDGERRMELVRDELRRVYVITQTIGSRFFQYYVGNGIIGPEPPGHEFYSVDHVLPFGYWLEYDEWVPTVHINSLRFGDAHYSEEDVPSEQRPDPFDPRGGSITFVPYYTCNGCHTTFPLGDQFVRAPALMGRHPPYKLHFSVGEYVGRHHSQLLAGEFRPTDLSLPQAAELLQMMEKFEAPDHAIALGVTCEACHLGAREHAEGKVEMPFFFPRSPHLCVEADDRTIDYGNTALNVNWACARCHSGSRRQLAAGMSTWNSTEYTDATRGSCYSQLRCIDCHNPHEAIGRKWTTPATTTDRVCLNCHQKFEPENNRIAHTHHPLESEGSRCMNCHMPHLNEGMQDVVRTHMIFSPTEPRMIEANHPNACNLCHSEESIDWTLTHLKDWYDADYSETKLNTNYSDRSESAALGWLNSRDHSVRLIGSDALTRTKSFWALEHIIEALDDPFLLNRQFAQRGLEQMMNVRLKDFGYRFYMTPSERKVPLERIKRDLQAKPQNIESTTLTE